MEVIQKKNHMILRRIVFKKQKNHHKFKNLLRLKVYLSHNKIIPQISNSNQGSQIKYLKQLMMRKAIENFNSKKLIISSNILKKNRKLKKD